MVMELLKKGLLRFKRESPEEKEKQVLKRITLEKIFSIKQRGFNKKGLNELSQVFKIFLMKHFDIGYEFTHNELRRELKKKEIANELRNKIIKVSDIITDINYKNKKLDKQLFYQLLKAIEEIIDLTTISTSIKKNIDLLKKGLEKNIKEIEEKTKKEEALPEEKKVSISDMFELESEMFQLEESFKMITEAQNALLNFDLEDAKQIYLGILHIYKKLPLEQQEKIYGFIKELYDTRKRLSYVLKSPTS